MTRLQRGGCRSRGDLLRGNYISQRRKRREAQEDKRERARNARRALYTWGGRVCLCLRTQVRGWGLVMKEGAVRRLATLGGACVRVCVCVRVSDDDDEGRCVSRSSDELKNLKVSGGSKSACGCCFLCGDDDDGGDGPAKKAAFCRGPPPAPERRRHRGAPPGEKERGARATHITLQLAATPPAGSRGRERATAVAKTKGEKRGARTHTHTHTACASRVQKGRAPPSREQLPGGRLPEYRLCPAKLCVCVRVSGDGLFKKTGGGACVCRVLCVCGGGGGAKRKHSTHMK